MWILCIAVCVYVTYHALRAGNVVQLDDKPPRNSSVAMEQPVAAQLLGSRVGEVQLVAGPAIPSVAAAEQHWAQLAPAPALGGGPARVSYPSAPP